MTEGRTAAALAEALGDAARLLAPLLPGLRTAAPPAPDPDPAHARFALFQAIARLLRWQSAARPLVLVLDDLHAADQASILLLEFLARELRASPVLLIGCFRDVEAH